MILPIFADTLCEMEITVLFSDTLFSASSTSFSVSASRFAVISSNNKSFGLAAAAGGEGQQAGGSQQSGEQALSGFLHKSFLLLIHYLFPFRTAEEKTRLCGNLGQFLFAGNKLRTNS